MTLTDLPSLNAGLNATSAVLLLSGFFCIRAKLVTAHACFMVGAFITSTCFLVSYLIYHAHVGSVRFLGTGWIRPAYFTLLISHTVLAIVIVPLVMRTLFLAASKRFPAHKAMARRTLPLWLYVCVTGLVVYWMLYCCHVAEACPGCKESLFDPGQIHQKLSLAKGYAVSIALMLAMPLALLGGVAGLIIRARRRQSRLVDSAGRSR